MSGGGGSSSSSSASTTNQSTTQGVEGDNFGYMLSNSSNNTIEILDGEAIGDAFEFSSASSQLAFEFATRTLDLQQQLLARQSTESSRAITENLEQALAFVDDQNKPDGGLTLDIVTPLVAGFSLVAVAGLYFALRS